MYFVQMAQSFIIKLLAIMNDFISTGFALQGRRVGIAPKIFIFRPKEYRWLKSLVQRLLLISGKRIACLNYDQFPQMHCEFCEFFTPKVCGYMQFFLARDLYKFYDFFQINRKKNRKKQEFRQNILEKKQRISHMILGKHAFCQKITESM